MGRSGRRRASGRAAGAAITARPTAGATGAARTAGAGPTAAAAAAATATAAAATAARAAGTVVINGQRATARSHGETQRRSARGISAAVDPEHQAPGKGALEGRASFVYERGEATAGTEPQRTLSGFDPRYSGSGAAGGFLVAGRSDGETVVGFGLRGNGAGGGGPTSGGGLRCGLRFFSWESAMEE